MRKLLVFPILFTCLGMMAQDTLRTVQVNANRLLRDTGIQKTTLDTLFLHDNISLSMADILSRHTTLFIKNYGRATESTAEFRGTSPSHTQVLWNGIRINSPMLGTLDFSTIPGYFVDETNLYHGASSISISGGGLGGAVELKTRPVDFQGTTLQYIQGIGSYDTYDQFFRATYANEQWSSSTRVSYSTSNNDFLYTNYDKKVDIRDQEGNIIDSYHPKERNKSGYFDDFHVMQDIFYNDLKGNRIGFMAWYSYTNRGLPFLSVDYKDDSEFTNEQKFNTARAVISWDHNLEKWNLNVKGGYQYQDMAYDYFTRREEINTDITHSKSYTNTGSIQGEANYIPNEHWLLQANMSAYYNHVRSYDRSPFHIGDNYDLGRMEYNTSIQARWRPIQPFSMAVVLREEVYRDDFVPLIPAFFVDYVLYQPWRLALKASVARNYRYPSMNDLYFQPGGNPDLEPEHGFTYDAGLEFCIPIHDVKISGNLSAFDSYINDWIQWLPNTKGFWEPSNVRKVHNYGTEMSLNVDYKISSNWRLRLSGNYAFTPSINRGENLNSNDASYGKQLCYVPRNSANISGHLSWESWTFTYKWNHYSERYTTTSNEVNYITGRLKPYYMSDISLEKTFQWRWGHASIKGVVNNLFNTKYVTVLSRPMAPRNYEIYFEFRPQWKRKSSIN
ncbi:MAG: TonB-dependent receptor [Bacteroidaceae bacterium]|nr:TonB-dependent receptor [Bacteroidaceae bacterium]